jgi:hypothetical protein
MMMLVLGLLVVAGISLVFGLCLSGFIASLLCVVAFFNNAGGIEREKPRKIRDRRKCNGGNDVSGAGLWW